MAISDPFRVRYIAVIPLPFLVSLCPGRTDRSSPEGDPISIEGMWEDSVKLAVAEAANTVIFSSIKGSVISKGAMLFGCIPGTNPRRVPVIVPIIVRYIIFIFLF